MYCKFCPAGSNLNLFPGINSSKVYCKYRSLSPFFQAYFVLIVAKCIVNNYSKVENITESNVLIVAKCIVNGFSGDLQLTGQLVLIVAKCIVNL